MLLIPWAKRCVTQKPQLAEHHQKLLNLRDSGPNGPSAAAFMVILVWRSWRSFSRRNRGKIVRIKALALFLILAVCAGLFVEMRKDNRADAAASNCYSDSQGPSTPTVCN
jgi:hypothetical protein